MSAAALTAVVTLIGLYLAHNLRRQQRIKVAELRIDAYRMLWEYMEVAAPTRLTPVDGRGPMTPADARRLYANTTAWYFRNGNGMLMTSVTRNVYLEAKRRLGAFVVEADGRDEASWASASRKCMRELSLLRTQMKSDVAIFGAFYRDSLNHEDEEFLTSCGISPKKWARPGVFTYPTALASRREPLGPRFPGRATSDTPRAQD